MRKDPHKPLIIDNLTNDVEQLHKRLQHPITHVTDEWIISDLFHSLYVKIIIALELNGLSDSVKMLASEWDIVKDDITRYTQVDEQWEMVDSPAFRLLKSYAGALRMVGDPQRQAGVDLLTRILGKTAVFLREINIIPSKEEDIKKPMNALLSSVFVDYIDSPSISGIVQNFKPDGGVKSIRTAIEYKFAASEAEIKTATTGIFEDIAGYKGSLDWNYFIASIYMTEPFKTQEQLQADIDRVGGRDNWRVIVVNGGKDAIGRKKHSPKV